MMSTSTLGTGLRRLLNPAAALALLLLVAGGASAQSTIFVDANGGDDGNTGQQPTVNAGVNGPVATIGRALQLVANNGVISIEAGEYDADLDITSPANLTFLARPDQDGNTEVELDVDGGEFLVATTSFTFASQGGGMFSFIGGGDFDLQSGTVALGSNVVSLDGIDVVEQTNASVTGAVGYGVVPEVIRYNGDASVTQSSLLPPSLDIATGTLLIDVALGSVASTVNDAARTFTLNGGLTLGDDGGAITLRVRDGNTVAGTITVVDGSGADDPINGNVRITGEGAVGDLVVSGGRLVFDLLESDTSFTPDSNNSAASVTVNSGQFVLPNEDPDADDLDRYRVRGAFVQTGGQVVAQNPTDTILVVEGNFRRTANVGGNFSPLNLYLEGTAAADFAPGTNLTINSLHINATGNTATQVKMVTFLQDITVNSSATGTNAVNNVIPFIVTGDAEVDLNGNLVNITQGGESIVDGTVSDSDNSGAVRFTNGGVASGNSDNGPAVYSSILVSGPSITAMGDFDFSGALILLQGGINVAAGSDVSPIGPSAGVIVNIAAANPPQIMGPGTFNDDEREYDLTYQDSNSGNGFQAFVADVEFDTDFIRNLTVTITNATVTLPDGVVDDGSISGDVLVSNGETAAISGTQTATLELNGQTITVLGSTTVEENALIDLLGDAILRVSGPDNVLDGTIDDSDGDGAGLGRLVLLDGSVVSGTQTAVTGTTGATTESVINARVLLNEGATAELSMLRAINGDLGEGDFTSAAQGGTLTIGLVRDSDSDPTDSFNQDVYGNINGDVNLGNTTLILSTPVELTADGETIEVGTLDTQGNVFFLEGPSGLNLYSDVIGTGAVWPASDDLTINAAASAPRAITIPVFHPGDTNGDVTSLDADILVTTTLRLTGVLDADSEDDSDGDYAVTLMGQDGFVPTLIVDDGYSVQFDGSGEPENDTDQELVIDGPINLTTNEDGTVNPYTDLNVLATENVQTFTVTADARFNAVDDPYTVMTAVINGTLDLNTNELAVMGDATIVNDRGLFNSAGGGNRIIGESTINPNYSSLSFVGDADATLTVTPNTDTGVATFGNGVDLRIAKATSTTTVTLAGSPLVFDDDFTSGGIFSARGGSYFDDETLILEMGVFVVGDPSEPNDLFVRLDHTNRLAGSATSDEGQGFVFVPATTQFPMSFVQGNVRKRIYSDPSDESDDITPGRVVYPVGTADEGDEGYAEFVLDFESISQSQSFGRRNVTVSFVDEFAGGTLGLPITSAQGTQVDEPANFYWLVRSDPSLGSGTFFNVEARYDGYTLASPSNDGIATVDELTLIRRQFGDETTNPWTLVSEVYDNFLLLDGATDSDPVVIAQGAEAFLGPQGTLFTYGLTQGNRPVANEGEIPTEFALNGNQPNPFSARTAISFDLPEAAEVSLEVYDVMGRRVVSIDKGAMTAGADQRVELDGSGLASGVYVFRLNAVGASETWTRSGQITLAR